MQRGWIQGDCGFEFATGRRCTKELNRTGVHVGERRFQLPASWPVEEYTVDFKGRIVGVNLR